MHVGTYRMTEPLETPHGSRNTPSREEMKKLALDEKNSAGATTTAMGRIKQKRRGNCKFAV